MLNISRSDVPMEKKIKKLSQRVRVYDELKHRIIFGRYSPGVVLDEKEICHDLKISRTPYREALFRLELDGLVLIKPKVGVVVTHTDLPALKDVFELRTILEGIAAQLAFKRMHKNSLEALREVVEKTDALPSDADIFLYLEMDARFHQIIHEAQGNIILKDMLDKLYNQCMRLWNTIGDQELMADLIKSSIRDIKKVYLAFVNNDPDEVERLVKEHFSSYLHTLISHLLGRTENGIISRGA
jgi:DNA-binding GntR family transcriptional regulator